MSRIIAVLFLLVSTNLYAAIGSVSDTKGTDCQIERNKQKLSGVKGSEVESMDIYITGGCVSNITFKDDTKVKVTENSRLLIDDFVYDPKKSDAGKLVMKATMGTVRYASGQIAKNNPQSVDIKTPSANIAVRGTDFTMTVDEAGQSLVVLLPSCKDDKDIKQYELQENTCATGKIEVSTNAGSVVLDHPFQGTYVLGSNIQPTPPRVLNIIENKINTALFTSNDWKKVFTNFNNKLDQYYNNTIMQIINNNIQIPQPYIYYILQHTNLNHTNFNQKNILHLLFEKNYYLSSKNLTYLLKNFDLKFN